MKICCPYCDAEFDLESFSGSRKFQCGGCEQKFLFAGGRSFKYGVFADPMLPGMDRLICPGCGGCCDITRGTRQDTLITCSACRTTFAVPKSAVIPPRPADLSPQSPETAVPVAQQPVVPPLRPIASDNVGEALAAAKQTASLIEKAAAEKLDKLYDKMPLDKINRKLGGRFDVRSKKFKNLFLAAAAALLVLLGLVAVGVTGVFSSGPKQIARKWQTAVVEQGIDKANREYALPDDPLGIKNVRTKISWRFSDLAESYFLKHAGKEERDKHRFDSDEHIKFFAEHFRKEKFSNVKKDKVNGQELAMVSSENYYLLLLKTEEGWKVVEFGNGGK